MKELVAKITEWAHARNIINGSLPIDQAMKLFSEFGELSDNVGKGKDCRDDIGDVFVVLTIMCSQYGLDMTKVNFEDAAKEPESLKQAVVLLCSDLFFVSMDKIATITEFDESVSSLIYICNQRGYTLQECVEIAYNDIKDRKGIMHNGVFIKESDPHYNDIVKQYS